MYRSLLLSLGESVFVKLVAIAALLFLATRLRSRWSVSLAGAAVIVATWFAVQDRIVYSPAPALPNGTLDAWSRTTKSLNAPDHFTYRQDGFGPGVQEADGRSGRAAVLYRSSVGNSMLRYGVPDVGRYRGRHVRMSFWVRSDRRFDTVQADLQDGVSAPVVVTVQTRPRWQRHTIETYVDPNARLLLMTFNATSVTRGGIYVEDLALDVSARARVGTTRNGTFGGLLQRFAQGPLGFGALFGLALSVIVLGDRRWRNHVGTASLFLLFVYYYGREGRGDLAEIQVLASAPWPLIMTLGAFVWLGCREVLVSRRAQLLYGSIVFVFVMRDQGQIALSYVIGWQWIATRDNYLVDFAFVALAMLGLRSLEASTHVGRWPLSPRFGEVVAFGAVGAVLLAIGGKPYYIHPLMGPPPGGTVDFAGVPGVRAMLRGLSHGPTTRIAFTNDEFMEFHQGVGSALLEGVGEVSLYSSLPSARYRAWTIFHQLGIRPEQKWRGYTNETTPGTLARLAPIHTLGYSNAEIYRYTVVSRPPLDRNVLELLGVDYAVRIFPGPVTYTLAPATGSALGDDVRRLAPERAWTVSGGEVVTASKPMYVAKLATPLPRAFLLHGVSAEQQHELENELAPRVGGGHLRTASFDFPLSGARITRYEPERVSVEVGGDVDSVLVLSDLIIRSGPRRSTIVQH